MDGPLERAEKHNGLGDPGLSRYGVLYASMVFWLALGAWLYRSALWPSTCTPGDLVEIYACSARLPESGRWVESALLTWLWSTPLLALLEFSRRIDRHKGKEEP